MIFSHATTNCI